jgi:hypothetical protein
MVSMSMSADAARRALEDAKGDDEFVRRYLDGDQAAFMHMQGLLQAAYPDDGSIDSGNATRDDAGLTGPEPASRAPAMPSGDGGGSALSDWLLEAGDAGFAPPKSPAHYQLDYAPNVEIDPEFDRQARDWMYRAELPAGWAGEIARDYQRRAAKSPSADEVAQEREAVLGRLRRDWGEATDAKLAQVRGLIGGIGDDRLTETLDRSGLGNNEWLIRQLAILADRNAARAAEKGENEGREGSKSNDETGATDRGMGHEQKDSSDRGEIGGATSGSNPVIQITDRSDKGAIGETAGPEIAPRGVREEGRNEQTRSLVEAVWDIVWESEDSLRRLHERKFGPDMYARTKTEPPPPGIGKIELFRSGNWAGKGFSAGHTSPSFMALKPAERDIPPITNADGKVNLFDYVSREHDLAYNDAQQKLLEDLKNPNISAQKAFGDYYTALANADREFLAKMAAGSPDMSLSGDPWETEMIRRAREAFSVTAPRYDTLAKNAYHQPNLMFESRQHALADASLKLRWLGEMVNGDVVGQKAKIALDALRSRIAELGGDPHIWNNLQAYAYVGSPEEANAAYRRRKEAQEGRSGGAKTPLQRPGETGSMKNTIVSP